jgi:hypothetical protein
MGRRRYRDIWNDCTFHLGRAIEEAEFEAALHALQRERRIRLNVTGPSAWVTLIPAEATLEATPVEPVLEAELMPSLDHWLRNEFVSGLKNRQHAIVRDTSRGGAGDGVW